MKKWKFLTPIMATVAATTPAMATLTSCGKIDYTEIVSEIKDSTISVFMDLAKTTHRASWDEGEVYEYIVKKMTEYGYTRSGEDRWSEIPGVKDAIVSEIQSKYTDVGKTKASRPYPGKKVKSKSFINYGNIWYDIPASEGMEDAPKIIINAHMDASMAFNSLTETQNDKENWINATNDIVNVTYDRDNELLKTDQTTSLGADAGLGIAAMLTLAKLQNKFKHGGIRLLFTAGESETTDKYASGSDFLYNDQIYHGRELDESGQETGESYLEEDSTLPFGEKGEFPYIVSTSGIYKNSIYTSSAGIHDCEIKDEALTLNRKDETDDYTSNWVDWTREVQWEGETTKRTLNLFTIDFNYLKGGQSGKYINSGYASALQMLMEMLFTSDYGFRLFSAESHPGNRAIPTHALATFATNFTKEELDAKLELVIESNKIAFPNDDWTKFTHSLEPITSKSNYKYSLSPKQSRAFTRWCAYDLVYGPLEWFDKEHQKVKTSCNFCDLIMEVDQSGTGNASKFHMHNVCRSADISSLYAFHYIAETLTYDTFETFYEFNPATGKTPYETAVEHTTHMSKPVWENQEDNKIVNILKKGYENLGISPTLWDNHGWVEVACVPRIYRQAFGAEPYVTCLGPEIRNSHEVDEEVWTDSLTSCLGALVYVIDNIKNI